mmetsp:Transcript_48085/g.145232  ORF Transcript_48085/g.145232 Transcript_48085/m.145232 type:complete len:268 (+) Transcript_48085:908-1711(+)
MLIDAPVARRARRRDREASSPELREWRRSRSVHARTRESTREAKDAERFRNNSGGAWGADDLVHVVFRPRLRAAACSRRAASALAAATSAVEPVGLPPPLPLAATAPGPTLPPPPIWESPSPLNTDAAICGICGAPAPPPAPRLPELLWLIPMPGRIPAPPPRARPIPTPMPDAAFALALKPPFAPPPFASISSSSPLRSSPGRLTIAPPVKAVSSRSRCLTRSGLGAGWWGFAEPAPSRPCPRETPPNPPNPPPAAAGDPAAAAAA